ncbi:hypothetical protein CCAX7_36520 [Capsulimonas corticalis]|uniref:Uncharacterized protein n=1 Tax=Capsulimonas corticalis TaxID=2219043 RepID=A0A402D1F3_9BACT|nr:hypothetical protein CCAX7_36520 [Capsulimonas corticalis]
MQIAIGNTKYDLLSLSALLLRLIDQHSINAISGNAQITKKDAHDNKKPKSQEFNVTRL